MLLAAVGVALALVVTVQFRQAVEAVAVRDATVRAQAVQRFKATQAEQHQQIFLTVQAVAVAALAQSVVMDQVRLVALVAQVSK